jgi:hypothetical protein
MPVAATVARSFTVTLTGLALAAIAACGAPADGESTRSEGSAIACTTCVPTVTATCTLVAGSDDAEISGQPITVVPGPTLLGHFTADSLAEKAQLQSLTWGGLYTIESGSTAPYQKSFTSGAVDMSEVPSSSVVPIVDEYATTIPVYSGYYACTYTYSSPYNRPYMPSYLATYSWWSVTILPKTCTSCNNTGGGAGGGSVGSSSGTTSTL